MIFKFIPERISTCDKCLVRYMTVGGHECDVQARRFSKTHISAPITYLWGEASRDEWPYLNPEVMYENPERLELIKLRAKVKELEARLFAERRVAELRVDETGYATYEE